MRKTEFLVAILLLAGLPALASGWETEFFSGGQITTSLDRNSALAGETVNASLQMKNLSGAPLSEVYAVVQLIREKTETGKSQENIISETMTEKYFLNENESKTIEVPIVIPKKAETGRYRLDFYLKTPRSFIVGIPFIFVYPNSTWLDVENPGHSKDISIDREKTTICGTLSEKNFEYGCYPGPVGVIGKAGAKNKISISVKNAGPSAETALLKISFYSYDDTVEEMLLGEKTIQKNLDIGPEGLSGQEIEFAYPEKPGAYAVRIELFDGNGELLSLYRHRINVEGVSARLVELVPEKKFFKAGELALVEAKIISPSDSKSADKNCDIRFSVKEGGREIHSETKKVNLTQDLPLQTALFEFIAPQALYDFEISAEILSSDGKPIDKFGQKTNYDNFSRKIERFDFNLVGLSGRQDGKILYGDRIRIESETKDELGRDGNTKIECFLIVGAQKKGPIIFEKNFELNEQLPPGDCILQCEAGDAYLEKPFFIYSAKKIVAKFSDDCEFPQEKTTFRLGQEICIKAEAFDETGKLLKAQITLGITNNNTSIGPIAFSEKTKVADLLEGSYLFTVESGGLRETYAIQVEEPLLEIVDGGGQTTAVDTPTNKLDLTNYIIIILAGIATILLLVGGLRTYRKKFR
jgi:hypothetical protein